MTSASHATLGDNGQAQAKQLPLAWLCTLLSCLCTGLGQIHSGRLQRGLAMFLVSMLFVPVMVTLSAVTPSLPRLLGLLATALVVLGVTLSAIIDAWFCGKKPLSNGQLSPWLYVAFILTGIAVPGASISWLRSHTFEAYRNVGASMEPALFDGDRLLVNHATLLNRPLQRGDIVVFHSPTDSDVHWVKRVVGLPGDVISLQTGQRLQSKTLGPTESGDRRIRVSPGTVFLVGDNLENSLDSRSFGPLPRDSIVGVAEDLHFPAGDWGRFGPLGRASFASADR